MKFLPEDDCTDDNKVYVMMNTLHLDMTKINEVRRVGKVVPGKIRPLLLKFVDSEAHLKLLQNARQLRIMIDEEAVGVDDDDELVLQHLRCVTSSNSEGTST